MDISVIASSPFEAFVSFKYPEIKDLLKHFLTLISATLVFSVTFSEKVVDYHNSRPLQKRIVYCAWLLLVVALGCCGLGIYLNFITAEAALAAIGGASPENFFKLASASYFFQDAAGVLYGLGLLALVSSVMVRGDAIGVKQDDT